MPDLYKLLDYEIREKIIKLPIFKKLMVNKQKDLESILTANWLVRNFVAHPVLNLEEEFNKLSTFTFVEKKLKNNSERIKYFYKLLKKNLMCKSNFKLFNNKNFTLLNF